MNCKCNTRPPPFLAQDALQYLEGGLRALLAGRAPSAASPLSLKRDRHTEGRAGGLLLQAIYINALAVSVLRLFEPAGLITLGQLFLHWVNFFLRFILLFFMRCTVAYTFYVRFNLYPAGSKITRPAFYSKLN
jgi:hypothetical protein